MDIINEINLQTGDLILFTGNTFISKFIQYFQHNEPIGTRKYGVQLNLLDDILKLCSKSTVYVRNILCKRDDEFYQKFRDAYLQIKDIPYDTNMIDWIAATFKLDYHLSDDTNYYLCIPLPYRKTDYFWCSSMTAYVFCKLGLIDEKINWTLISPSEFSCDQSPSIQFLCQVNPKKLLF